MYLPTYQLNNQEYYRNILNGHQFLSLIVAIHTLLGFVYNGSFGTNLSIIYLALVMYNNPSIHQKVIVRLKIDGAIFKSCRSEDSLICDLIFDYVDFVLLL